MIYMQLDHTRFRTENDGVGHINDHQHLKGGIWQQRGASPKRPQMHTYTSEHLSILRSPSTSLSFPLFPFQSTAYACTYDTTSTKGGLLSPVLSCARNEQAQKEKGGWMAAVGCQGRWWTVRPGGSEAWAKREGEGGGDGGEWGGRKRKRKVRRVVDNAFRYFYLLTFFPITQARAAFRLGSAWAVSLLREGPKARRGGRK